MRAELPRQWVGIDVGRQGFVAARRCGDQIRTEQFGWSSDQLEAFARWLPAGRVTVLFEASGPYGAQLRHALESQPQRIAHAMVNPRRVRAFAKASPERNKTDPIDAVLLLQFGETFTPSSSARSCDLLRRVQALWRHHQALQLLLDRTRDRQQKAAADPQMPALLADSLQELIDSFRAQQRRVAEVVQTTLEQDPQLQRSADLLRSIPGVGQRVALTLISEFGSGLWQATAKQMTAYAGLDPVRWESGTSVRRPPRISKQGNARIRKALYMAALVAIRHNPPLRSFYQARAQAGEPGRKLLVACMRKLLHQCHGVLKHQQPFDPAYASP